MKKLLIVLFVVPLFSGCLMLNALGVTDSVRGDEAADRIFTAALVGGLLAGNDFVSAFLAEVLTGIEEGEYYAESDVKNCENALYYASPFISFGRVLVLGGVCTLEADGVIY